MTAIAPFAFFLLKHPAMTGDGRVFKDEVRQSVLEFLIGIVPKDNELHSSLKKRLIAVGINSGRS